MSPGTYEGQFIVRKVGAGDAVTQSARLVVGPPLGRLKIDAPEAQIILTVVTDLR